ncbi:MAG: CynX/NimT family MFS transporter [Desulfonatronovibrio sp.]
MIPVFIRNNPRLAFYAFMAVLTSGFGQTFFVSVMGGEIRAAFDLSHTAYGTIYSLATVTSAMLLFRLGGLADTWSLSRITILAVAALAAGCLLIGLAPGVFVLGIGFVLIRFGGQGYISHLGITTAARYFSVHQGKAVAFAASGFPVAEAILPACAVFILGLAGWRWSWMAGAIVLMVLILPVLLFLAGQTPAPAKDKNLSPPKESVINYTRKQVLTDPGFYMLLPAAVATPFTVTAIMFHQVAIADLQGWSLQLVASAFSAYAAGHLSSLFFAGVAVDRFGAERTLPFSLFPMITGMLILAWVSSAWVALVYLGLVGITQGFASTSAGAVWAQRYGVTYLGAIRSMAQATMVVATSIAPVLVGFLLDLDVGVTVLSLGMAAGLACASALAVMAPKPDKKH